jgi:hypothetical protein
MSIENMTIEKLTIKRRVGKKGRKSSQADKRWGKKKKKRLLPVASANLVWSQWQKSFLGKGSHKSAKNFFELKLT